MKQGPTPHWYEVDETKEPWVFNDGVVVHYTERAWNERFEYAYAKYLKEWSELQGMLTDVRRSRASVKYAGIVFVNVETGEEEDLVTPDDFAERHGMSPKTVRAFLHKDQHQLLMGKWAKKESVSE